MSGKTESLTDTLAKQAEARFSASSAVEKSERAWLASVLPNHQENCESSSVTFHELLKDGVLLCELINKLAEAPLTKISTSNLPFKQRENLSGYLLACEKVGMSQTELFETSDLFESKNLQLVLQHMAALHVFVNKNGGTLKDVASKAAAKKGVTAKFPTPDAKLKSSASGPVSSSSASGSPSAKSGVAALSSSPGSVESSPGKPKTPSVASLAADIATKEEFKYNPEVEAAAQRWIEKVTGEEAKKSASFHQYLKSGVVLCKLANTIQPNIVAHVYEGNLPYRQMENIGWYIKACQQLGMRDEELFETADLFVERNLNSVVNHIHVLAHWLTKRPEGWNGPAIEDVRDAKSLFSATLVDSSLSWDPNATSDETPLTDDQKELLNWANAKMSEFYAWHSDAKKFEPFVNLSGDVKSGVKLIHLLIALGRGGVSFGMYNTQPTLIWHAMQNASAILAFIASQTFEKVEGVRAVDLVTGNVSAISRLLFYLREKFDLDYLFAQTLGDLSDLLSGSSSTADTASDTIEVELVEGDDVPAHLRPLMTAEDLQYYDQLAKERREAEALEFDSPHDSETTHDIVPPQQITPPHTTDETQETADEKIDTQPVAPIEPQPTEVAPSPVKKAPGKMPKKSESKEPSTVEKDVEPKKPTPKAPKPSVAPIEPQEQVEVVEEEVVDSGLVVTPGQVLPLSSSSLPIFVPTDSAPSTPPVTHDSTDGESLAPGSGPKWREGKPDRTKDLDSDSGESKASRKLRREKVVDGGDSVDVALPKEEAPKVEVKPPVGAGDTNVGQASSDSIASAGEKSRVHMRERSVTRRVNIKRTATIGAGKVVVTDQEKVMKAQQVVRKHVAVETLTTEQSYLNSLQTLIRELLEPVKRAKVLTTEEYASLFSNVEAIANHHVRFESLLKGRIAAWDDGSILSDIFLHQTAFFSDYGPYLQNYNKATAAMHYMRKKRPKLDALIRGFEDELMKTTMQTVDSFLIMPVQRLPRYRLLLSDMRKYTAPSWQEHAHLEQAVNLVDNVLHELNSHIQKDGAEQIRKMLAVESSIQGDIPVQIMKLDRKFIKEGPILVKKIKIGDKTKPERKKLGERLKGLKAYAFLFSDLLIICETLKHAKSDDKCQFAFVHSYSTQDAFSIAEKDRIERNMDQIANFSIKHADKKNKDIAFYLHVESDLIVLHTNSPEDREAWISGLKKK